VHARWAQQEEEAQRRRRYGCHASLHTHSPVHLVVGLFWAPVVTHEKTHSIVTAHPTTCYPFFEGPLLEPRTPAHDNLHNPTAQKPYSSCCRGASPSGFFNTCVFFLQTLLSFSSLFDFCVPRRVHYTGCPQPAHPTQFLYRRAYIVCYCGVSNPCKSACMASVVGAPRAGRVKKQTLEVYEDLACAQTPTHLSTETTICHTARAPHATQ
jgi:hypothetical protein